MKNEFLSKSTNPNKKAETIDSGSDFSKDETKDLKPASSHTYIDLEDPKNQSSEDTSLEDTSLEEENEFNSELEKGFPVKNWDRFEFRKLLGYGGMGIVYQAWDTKLNRMVALKFLRNSYGQASKRFLQEARAQCRIEHPNVCRVYEAGEVDNIPYIAMQHIEGTTLRLAYQEMSLEQKVQVMRDIALAIQSAHKLGIIHRDIKPDNVMLTKKDDGQFCPIVMDFGLAKEVGNKGLTQTGALIGTPSYMAPEQARGQIQLLDRRTDVYSLGAMFYSIVAGKAPFQGSSPMEVVLKVISDDAQSISQVVPSIPKDINTIIMKCLEKDPKHRYESAQGLADDLNHYLAGEPISTRARSWYVFFWKKALKHKALVAVSATALLIVIILSAISVWTWIESSRRAEFERQMAEQAEKIEATMRFVSLTQPHDIRAERQMAQQEIEIIKKQMNEGGYLAQGPGNYALGRSYLAFSDYEKAREHLELAYKSGFRTSALELAMGQMLGEFYRRELDNLRQSEDKEIIEARLKKLDKEYLEPIQKHLTAYLNAKSKSSTQEVTYLEGLLALYKKDYKTALDKANMAMGQSSWYYEAYLLKGEIYLTWSQKQATEANYDEANNLLIEAEKAFQEASKIGPSNLQAKIGQARKWAASLYLTIQNSNKSPIEAFEETLLATDKILEIDPDNGQASIIKMRAYSRLADVEVRDGKDPNQKLEKAIYWGERAIKSTPKDVEIYRSLGTIYRILGKYALDHGDNPHNLYDLAIKNLEKAIELKPKYDSAYSTMGLIYQAKGQYEEKTGKDPQNFYEKATNSFKKALEISPNSPKTATNLGRLYRVQGEYEQKNGKNPRPFYEQANVTFQKALELNPKDPYVYTNLSLLYQTRAEYEIETGKDPQALFEQATRDLQKAIELNPNYMFAYNSLGILYQIRAEYELGYGKDPRPSVEQATLNFKKVFQIRPEYGVAYYTLGLVYQIRAQYEIEHGQEPNSFFEQATLNFEKAIEINPKNTDAYNGLGFTYYSKLEHEINLGREIEVGKLFDQALSNFRKSLEINPKQFEPNLYSALLFSKRAQLQSNKNLVADIEESRLYLNKAISIKSNLEWAYRIEAEIELIIIKKNIKENRPLDFTKAKVALKKALEIKANNARGYTQLASVLLLEASEQNSKEINKEINKEKLNQGLEIIEKSLAINPNNAESYAIKGAILLEKAKTSNDQTLKDQGLALLEKAIQTNQWLKYKYEQILSQSKN